MINFKKGVPSINSGQVSTPIAIAIIVVLVILVGGGILGYQYYWLPKQEAEEETKLPETETPKDETADWKTYRNEEYGFEIKYPADAEIKKLDKSISFIFADNQRQLNVEVITEAEPNECYKTAWAADVPDISLDGIIFKGIGCGLKCEPYDKIQYCAIRNGIAYKLFPQIVYIPEKHNFVERDNILNQMLSTFRFID